MPKISHDVIEALYKVLDWYTRNRWTRKAGVILYYFSMWKEFHALTVNISDEGWKDIKELASRLRITLSGKSDEELLLFAVETYLHLFIRALALSKLGMLQPNINGFWQEIGSLRGLFEHSIFEWFFEAFSDPNLQQPLRQNLVQSIDIMLQVLYGLDTASLTTDVFREIYQNVLPPGIRKSLGEFYTSDYIVDKVLDAAGLDAAAAQELYERWKKSQKSGKSEEKPIVLDPACGSGSFLVKVVDRLFKALMASDGTSSRCSSDILKFLQDVVVGIDVNPFAVEMARLNLALKLSDVAHDCKTMYIPSSIRVYWADSLAKIVKESPTKFAKDATVYEEKKLKVFLPALAEIIGGDRVDVPVLNSLGPVELLELAYDLVEKGQNVDDFIQRVESRSSDALNRREELKALYGVVEKLHKHGNRKLLELLKNATEVTRLVGKCDYVIGNPPWVRIHGVAKHVMDFLRKNYKYFEKGSTYDPQFEKTKTPFREQHDYSIAFVERGLEFLREGGVLSYVITSKIAKALYAGSLREDLVSNYTILEIRDYSLYPVPLFQDAVNYPMIIAVKKEKPKPGHKVKITVVNTAGEERTFELPQKELSADQRNRKSPWLLAPPDVVQAYRKIARASKRLGDVYEVYMGVKTAANEIFIGKIKNVDCAKNIAYVELGVGVVPIELDILQLSVKGRDIDAFEFSYKEYVVFPYDNYLQPLWDKDQHFVLQALGVLNRNVEVGAAEAAVVYRVGATNCRNVQGRINNLQNQNQGYTVKPVTPCAVKACYEIYKGNNKVLDVRIDEQKSGCVIYIEGLRIPCADNATRHFVNPNNLGKLVRRDDYNASLPPWAVFRVSYDKFKDYRIGWQDIALHLEACILPVEVVVDFCGRKYRRLLIPDTTLFFIVEGNKIKAVKLLLYLNSELARSLLKLWAYVARGGYYRHKSVHVGLLPIPQYLINCILWNWLSDRIKNISADKLNEELKKVYEENRGKLEEELRETLGLSEEEYSELLEWGHWLNEQGVPSEPPLEGEEVEEE